MIDRIGSAVVSLTVRSQLRSVGDGCRLPEGPVDLLVCFLSMANPDCRYVKRDLMLWRYQKAIMKTGAKERSICSAALLGSAGKLSPPPRPDGSGTELLPIRFF